MEILGRRTAIAIVSTLLLTVPLASTGIASHGDAPEAWQQASKFAPSVQGSLGDALAVDDAGDTALAGAPIAAGNAGAVFVLGLDADGGWSKRASIDAPEADGQLGHAVALDAAGDTALIGARTSDTAYIFNQTSQGAWSKVAELTPADTSGLQAYGDAVALAADGDVAIVGDSLASTNSELRSGKVFIFERDAGTWSLVYSHAGTSGDGVGDAVAIDGSTAMVAAPGARTVDVLDAAGGWSVAATIDGGQNFGRALALDGDRALFQSGRTVEVYELSDGAWSKTATLEEPRFDLGVFGASVALDSGTAVVGVRGTVATAGGPAAGHAFVFEHHDGDWIRSDRLVANDGVPGDDTLAQFGGATAIQGDSILVGAPGETRPAGVQAGSVYAFRACEETDPLQEGAHGVVEPVVAEYAGDDEADAVHEAHCQLGPRTGVA